MTGAAPELLPDLELPEAPPPPRGMKFLGGASRVAGALLLLLGWAALGWPLQREPIVAVSVLALGALLGLSAGPRGLAGVLALVPVLPIVGTRLHGPWFAPAESLLLAAAGGALLRGGRLAAASGRLGRPLAWGWGAVVVSAVAATLASFPRHVLPGALRDGAAALHSLESFHPAAPLRSALIAGAGLFAYLAARRASRLLGGPAVLALLVIAATGVALYGAGESLFGWKLWPSDRYEVSTFGRRVVSTLPDYNSAGSFFALFLFPAAAAVATTRGLTRWGFGAATLALGTALVLTGSRAAWVATLLAGGIVATAWLRRRFREDPAAGRRGALFLASGMMVVVAMIAAWPGVTGRVLRDRVGSLVRPAETAHALAMGRVGFWRTGAAMLAGHPLAGIGPGRVPARFEEFRAEGYRGPAENLHAWPLQVLVENGIPGGLLALWPTAMLALLVLRSLRRFPGGDGDPFVGALAPGLLAFGISGLAAHPWLLPEMQVVFWGCAALLERSREGGTSRSAVGDEEGTAGAIRRWIPAALLLGWGLPRLLSAPASDGGLFDVTAGSFAEGGGEAAWVGPWSAGVLPAPPPGDPLRLRLRRPGREGATRVEGRVDGGRWAAVELPPGGGWTTLELPRPSSVPAGTPAGAAVIELRADRAFCPAMTGGLDRRRLSAQVALR